MTSYYVVETSQGINWVDNLEMRKQSQWTEHAAFMNKLEAEGFVVLGGPINWSETSSEHHDHIALLIIDDVDETKIMQRLSEDPWMKNKLLKINWIKKWDILLNRDSPVR